MQRLGKVLHVTPSKNIVARIHKIPKMGAIIIDEKLKVVGKIFDIVGPISSPYAIIRPASEKSEKLVNKQLYLATSKKRMEQ